MSDDRAGSRVATAGDDAVSADDRSTEPDGIGEPDFTPVSIESLHLVLDGLRQLN